MAQVTARPTATLHLAPVGKGAHSRKRPRNCAGHKPVAHLLLHRPPECVVIRLYINRKEINFVLETLADHEAGGGGTSQKSFFFSLCVCVYNGVQMTLPVIIRRRPFHSGTVNTFTPSTPSGRGRVVQGRHGSIFPIVTARSMSSPGSGVYFVGQRRAMVGECCRGHMLQSALGIHHRPGLCCRQSLHRSPVHRSDVVQVSSPLTDRS